MPYYAVYATRWRLNPFVAFSGAHVENRSELEMLCEMWPQLVTPRYNGSYCMIMEYF